jgi:predicted phosphodiesterase
MEILVISDTHLTTPFEEKKFKFLTNLILSSDRVIINGDFWDGYLTTFEKFIDSPWKNLFPLLKSKNTVYIFGNHDKSTFANKSKFKLFSDLQTNSYRLTINNISYLFEHGNRLLPFDDEKIIEPLTSPLRSTKIIDTLEQKLIRRFGSRFQKLLRKNNKIIKLKALKELKNNEYYVCGHTHCAEIDHTNRFINSGLIKGGLGQYLLIKNHSVYAHEARYN